MSYRRTGSPLSSSSVRNEFPKFEANTRVVCSPDGCPALPWRSRPSAQGLHCRARASVIQAVPLHTLGDVFESVKDLAGSDLELRFGARTCRRPPCACGCSRGCAAVACVHASVRACMRAHAQQPVLDSVSVAVAHLVGVVCHATAGKKGRVVVAAAAAVVFMLEPLPILLVAPCLDRRCLTLLVHVKTEFERRHDHDHE